MALIPLYWRNALNFIMIYNVLREPALKADGNERSFASEGLSFSNVVVLLANAGLKLKRLPGSGGLKLESSSQELCQVL